MLNASTQPMPITDTPSRWLRRVRALWLVFIVLNFGVWLANMPDTYQLLTTVCDAKIDPCNWFQPTPENLDTLASWGISLQAAAIYHLTLYILVSLFFWGAGLLVLWHRSSEWYGLLVSYLLITIGAGGVSFVFLSGDDWTGLAAVLAIVNAISIFPMYLALSFFFMTFPDGRIYPRWTWIGVALILLNYAAWLAPGKWNIQFWNPALVGLWLLFVFGTHIGFQIYRYRKFYTFQQRQQSKWLIYGFVLGLMLSVVAGVINYDTFYGMLSGTLVALSYLPVGVGVAIAILRYNLWDIDVVINRTLVYALLTGFVIATYYVIVGGLGVLFESRQDLPASLTATAFVAVGFQSVRDWAQRGVNRLMYGERDEPYKVITALGRRLENSLEPDAVLPTIVETVAQALKFPYAAIALNREDTLNVVAAYGVPPSESLIPIPLSYANQTLGELRLAPRSAQEALTPKDQILLDDLARQAGVAIHAVQLNIDLQRSRQQIVTEREEARRRLGSDLHDGIGQRLAGLLRKVDIASQPDTSTQVALDDIKQHLRQTIDDVRSLAHQLHPPELELLGLSEALQECIRPYYDTLAITLDVPTYLPKLPLAVEVAAYYLIQEALSNVSRHAHATTCRICIEWQPATLLIDIQDNGIGIATDRKSKGLGLHSMRNRAIELGGTFQIQHPSDGGTRICVSLPCFGQ